MDKERWFNSLTKYFRSKEDRSEKFGKDSCKLLWNNSISSETWNKMYKQALEIGLNPDKISNGFLEQLWEYETNGTAE